MKFVDSSNIIVKPNADENKYITRIPAGNFMTIHLMVEVGKNLVVHGLKLICLKLLIAGSHEKPILPVEYPMRSCKISSSLWKDSSFLPP